MVHKKITANFVILYRRSTPAGAEVNVWEISLKFPSLLEIFAVGEGAARPHKTKALSFRLDRERPTNLPNREELTKE